TRHARRSLPAGHRSVGPGRSRGTARPRATRRRCIARGGDVPRAPRALERLGTRRAPRTSVGASRGRPRARFTTASALNRKERPVMTPSFDLRRSQALWNRERLDLASDEILAQILDLGELEAWREIYRRAAAPTDEGAALRRRSVRLCCTVPVAFPHLFLAAMAHLGEVVDPGPEVAEVSNGNAAIAALHTSSFDIVLTHLKLAGSSGLHVLRAARALDPPTAVIVMTSFGSVKTAIEAIKGGAFDFMEKPFRF